MKVILLKKIIPHPQLTVYNFKVRFEEKNNKITEITYS